MGYRSDVQGIIYGEEDQVTALLVAARLEGNKHMDVLLEWVKEVKFRAGGYEVSGLYLRWDDVKWYDDYPEVKAWYRLRDKAEERGLAYEFVRLGEELEDMEKVEIGDTMGVLFISRTVHVNYALEDVK